MIVRIDQLRSRLAWFAVAGPLAPVLDLREYRVLVRSLPEMIHKMGLAATLRTLGADDRRAATEVLQHLGRYFADDSCPIQLARPSQNAPLAARLEATESAFAWWQAEHEADAFLVWLGDIAEAREMTLAVGPGRQEAI